MGMTIDIAREYLSEQYPVEYNRYIFFHLAGDFAVVLAEDHIRKAEYIKKLKAGGDAMRK